MTRFLRLGCSAGQPTSFRRLLAIVGLSAALTGCGGGPGVEIAPVSGRVTLDGRPVKGAYVEFIPKKGGRPSGGITDEEGRYTLQYSLDDVGAVLGPARVLVTTGDPENPKERPELIPARYNKQTILEVEVTADQHEHNFELTKK